MAEEAEDTTAPDHPAHLMALAGASRARADAWLEAQTRLATLQSQNLLELNAFELSHLKWRRFNDQMKGAMQIMLVLAGILIVAVIGATLWNARQAEGLVVDAFSVPPAFVASGTSGDVVAGDLTNKIGAVRDFANENSLARSKDVHQNRDQDIKVEIPDTGVSLPQVWRYLRQWLGHERRLGGSLRDLGGGRIALTAALDGDNAFTVSGRSDDLEGLEQQAAERVFQQVDPTNYVLYLRAKKRPGEVMAAMEHVVSLARSPTELSDAYSLWANTIHYGTPDIGLATARARMAVRLDPKTTAPHMELMSIALALGHDEEALAEALTILTLRKEDEPVWRNSDGVATVQEMAGFNIDLLTADFLHALSQPCEYFCDGRFPDVALRRAEYAARLHDPGRSRSLIGEATALGSTNPAQLSQARYFMNVATGDWAAAAGVALAYRATIRTGKGALVRETEVSNQLMPLLAVAQARSGDFAAAHRAIAATRGDCYPCLRARGSIAAAERNWGAAAYWFVRAAKIAPSIPFAHAEWGAMLLDSHEPDAAIAQFGIAHQISPRFADPLEGWGEALMAKNQSHLALEKFAEAEKYAPNWGRLHLKWGEALAYAGKPDEAKAQFARAAALDLSKADRTELSRMGP